MDLRFGVGLAETSTCDAVPEIDDLGIADARIVAPGAPARSVLSHRIHATTVNRMPPLGTRLVDTAGVKVVDDWIGAVKCP
jgi:hypothetical protein